MIEVKGSNIKMTRGDTLTASITIKDAQGGDYTVADTDVIRFAMKKFYTSEEVLVQKTIGPDLILTLEPSDTALLDFGKYVFDIKLTTAAGVVDTFIKGELRLTEVTV